jgi:hypothetical protein
MKQSHTRSERLDTMSKQCPECKSDTNSREIPEAEWLRVECTNCSWHKYYDLPPEDKVSVEYQRDLQYV